MKATQIIKSILTGAAAGAAIFFIPFPFRFLFAFLFILFVIRFFAWRRYRSYHGNHNSYNFWNPSYMHRWQAMSEEERKTFIKKMEAELFAAKPATE